MSGIYLHIPFCKQACTYCNFHFSTSGRGHEEMVEALMKECALRSSYLEEKILRSVYFGGGTPSLLPTDWIQKLLDHVQRYFILAPDAEITLEANPDDLSLEYLKALKTTQVNRLSIGVQSFFDEDLVYMHRAHQASDGSRAIRNAQSVGFNNLTIDLIYGTPGMGEERWAANLQSAVALDIPHLSCYALTVEPRTALHHQVQTGLLPGPENGASARHMELAMEVLEGAGYDHYEISNFAKPGAYAVHNSSYWKGVHYLGLGPSAHSFDGNSRQWNVANNVQYVKAINEGTVPFEREELGAAEQINELVLTRLRTIWGLDLQDVAKVDAQAASHLGIQLQEMSERGWVESMGATTWRLTRAGRLLADAIAVDLFV